MENNIDEFDFSYWRDHPAEYVEEYFGIELNSWQKMILKCIVNDNKSILCRPTTGITLYIVYNDINNHNM